MISKVMRTLCTIGVVILTLTACGGPASAPEEQLRAWVAAGAEAAKDKNRRELVSMISESYADARGNERAYLMASAFIERAAKRLLKR